MKKVYLAGKIGHSDWRHGIFKDLRKGNDKYFGLMDSVNNYQYNGPFFTSCDHGCFHGESNHGRGVVTIGCGCGLYGKDGSEVEGNTPKNVVIKDCVNDIKSSDVVFVWLESNDAFGTITEIGVAHALKKPIFIAVNKSLTTETMNEMWFPLHMANKLVSCDTASEGWAHFCKHKLL
ncbi:Nucleoside 2-deoxyribosyltransferase [compost metagenome]